MTAAQATTGTTAQALAAELALVWGARFGAAATVDAGAASADAGWVVTVPFTPASAGQVTVWFQKPAAADAMQAGLKLEVAPADEAVLELLRDVVGQAAQALVQKAGVDGVTLAPATAAPGPPPAESSAFEITVGGKGCGVQVVAELGAAPAAAPPNSRRLEAVLDVDLPLVVRFGRATMPLRALAVLGPGSVIDMGRSPDEPVELLVGDRVIARGEVVVVGGNYGVRITTLTGSQAIPSELEARTA